MTRVGAIWVVLLAATVIGCDSGCPAYWKAVCDTCGQESPACARSKEVGDTLKGKDAECKRTADGFNESAKGDTFRRRYCDGHDHTSPGDVATLTEGPWICSGVRVVFTKDSFKFGEEFHQMTDLQKASFQLTSGPAYGRRPDDGVLRCSYDLGPQDMSVGEVALALNCPKKVGLPSDWQVCLREHKR